MAKQGEHGERLAFNSIEMQRSLAAFKKKHEGMECPTCKCRDFIVAKGFASLILHTDYPPYPWGVQGGKLPAIGVVCKDCGNIQLFSLRALDLLD